MTCKHPDHDQPKMVCGYPLPCPYHTIIINAYAEPVPTLTIPVTSDAAKSMTLREMTTSYNDVPDRYAVLSFLKSYSVKIALPGDEFQLASGGKSRLYIDAKKTVLHRKMHHPIARLLAHQLHNFGTVDAVAGVVLGGCHLASLVASYRSIHDTSFHNVLFVRKSAKDHGTKSVVEKPWSSRFGESVVLFEDVLSTGKTSSDAVDSLVEDGYLVKGIVTLIDRRLPRDRVKFAWVVTRSIPIHHIFRFEDLGCSEEIARIEQ